MNQSRTLKAGAAVLIAALILIAWQYRAIARLKAENAGLRRDHAELARAQSENQRLQALAARRGSAGTGAASAGAPAAAQPGNRMVSTAALVASSMNRPEMRQLMALQQNSMLDSRYAALFKQLNLPADQLAHLKQLMVSRQLVGSDVFAAAAQEGLDPRTNRPELAAMVTDGQAKVDEEVQSLLGASGYAAYQDYQATLPQRAIVSQLQQSLSYAAEPLTDAQVSQLVGILAQNSAASANTGQVMIVSGSVSGGGPASPPAIFPGGGSAISSAAVAAAQSVLSPAQLAAFQQLAAQQAQMTSLMQSMRGPSGQGNVPVVNVSPGPP